MRIAIYGGSFNPPHVAHAMVAAWVRWTGAADAVWLVPVYRHAFEGSQDKVLAPYERRCAWCAALCDELGPGFEVSRVESELPVPSYSVDTLTALAQRHPEHRFRLVVGADVLPQTDQWKDWPRIERSFRPIVAGRAGYATPGRATVDFPDVSSTDLRSRIAAGEPFDHLVPAGVARLLRGVDAGMWRDAPCAERPGTLTEPR